MKNLTKFLLFSLISIIISSCGDGEQSVKDPCDWSFSQSDFLDSWVENKTIELEQDGYMVACVKRYSDPEDANQTGRIYYGFDLYNLNLSTGIYEFYSSIVFTCDDGYEGYIFPNDDIDHVSIVEPHWPNTQVSPNCF